MAYEKRYRERVIEYRQEGNTLEETRDVFKVSISTIRKWEIQLKEKGHLEKKELNRTHKKIDPQKLEQYIEEHPDAYLGEIAKVFNCSDTAVSKALKKLKITRKKKRQPTKSRIRKK